MALSDLTPAQRKLVEQAEQNKPEYQQLRMVRDIADMVQEVIRILDNKKPISDIGSLLVDMRESLSELSKKETPETPDYAKPIVKGLEKLETALSQAISKIDVKPQVKVDAPQVNVDSPSVHVDLKGVERVMKDLPKAFDKAIKSIPKTEIPEDDYTPLLNKLSELSIKLDDIDMGVRLKPQPGNMSIRINGQNVSSTNPLPITSSGTTFTVQSNASNTVDANPATQSITTRDISSVTTTAAANGQPSTIGTPTAGSAASYALTGYDSARVQVSGIWTGTLVAQVSLDGIIWYNQGVHQSGTTFTTSTFTGNFSGTTNAAGVNYWRVQSTTAWTGTAIVKVVASINPSSVYIANNVGINANSPNPVSTTSAIVNVGQKTVSTTAVQISAVSTVPTNGILIEALSTNAASIFIGGSGVTTSTGFEIQPGAIAPFTCNLNTLYIISVASTTDKICYNVT